MTAPTLGRDDAADARQLIHIVIAPDSGESALLRLVCIFHTKGIHLEKLVFDAARSTVRAEVAIPARDATRLAYLLRRAVEVVSVSIDAGEPE
ncbi:hypothetical protein ACWEO2_36155 [Nocardia sp. NPDC004278]